MVVLDQFAPIASGNSYILADVHWGTALISANGQSWNQSLYDKAKVTSIVVKCYKVGSPTGQLKCRIASHTGTYGTSSKALVDLETSTNSKDIALLSSNPARPTTVTFTFAGTQEILKNVNYTFYVYVDSGTLDGSNYALIVGDRDHDGNRFYTTTTEPIWAASSTTDITFTVNGEEILAETFIPVGDGLVFTIHKIPA